MAAPRRNPHWLAVNSRRRITVRGELAVRLADWADDALLFVYDRVDDRVALSPAPLLGEAAFGFLDTATLEQFGDDGSTVRLTLPVAATRILLGDDPGAPDPAPAAELTDRLAHQDPIAAWYLPAGAVADSPLCYLVCEADLTYDAHATTATG